MARKASSNVLATWMSATLLQTSVVDPPASVLVVGSPARAGVVDPAT